MKHQIQTKKISFKGKDFFVGIIRQEAVINPKPNTYLF